MVFSQFQKAGKKSEPGRVGPVFTGWHGPALNMILALLDRNNTGENYVLIPLHKFSVEKRRYGLLSVIWITNTEVIFPIGATASTI
jgi:hypothetical protein